MTDGRPEFKEFSRSHYPQLLRSLLFFAGGDPHRAQEALDHAMASAYEKWDSIRNPQAYIRRAALNHLIKENKRVLREPPLAPQPEQDHGEPGQLTGQEIWEQREWVDMILGQLPPAQREVLTWAVNNLRPAEIAELLGKNPDAVRQNLSAARKRLKKYLAETSRTEIAATAHGRRADER